MPAPTTLLDLLEPHGEQHLLAHWDQLSEEKRNGLQSQLMAIDWSEVATCKKLVEACQEKKSIVKPQGFETLRRHVARNLESRIRQHQML